MQRNDIIQPERPLSIEEEWQQVDMDSWQRPRVNPNLPPTAAPHQYTRIGIAWLHNQAFCEYQLVLKYTKAIPDHDTEETVDGKSSHLILAQHVADKAITQGHSKITDDIPTTLHIASADKRVFFTFEFRVECDLMIGSIDELVITDKLVGVTEYKHSPPDGKPPFRDDIRQTLAYAYCFKVSYPTLSLPIHCRLKDKHTGVPFWTHIYADTDAEDVLESVHRTLDIVQGKRVPVPTTNPKKCASCQYNNVCDKRCQ